jgi:hypothetical protein
MKHMDQKEFKFTWVMASSEEEEEEKNLSEVFKRLGDMSHVSVISSPFTMFKITPEDLGKG